MPFPIWEREKKVFSKICLLAQSIIDSFQFMTGEPTEDTALDGGDEGDENGDGDDTDSGGDGDGDGGDSGDGDGGDSGDGDGGEQGGN